LDVEVEGRTETLDQGDRSSMGTTGNLQIHEADQKGRDAVSSTTAKSIRYMRYRAADQTVTISCIPFIGNIVTNAHKSLATVGS
jgi:hypothetical protein